MSAIESGEWIIGQLACEAARHDVHWNPEVEQTLRKSIWQLDDEDEATRLPLLKNRCLLLARFAMERAKLNGAPTREALGGRTVPTDWATHYEAICGYDLVLSRIMQDGLRYVQDIATENRPREESRKKGTRMPLTMGGSCSLLYD